MIQSLRSRHRSLFIVLSVVTPLVFAAGLISRQPIPTVANFPAEVDVAIYASDIISSTHPELDRLQIEVRLRRGAVIQAPPILEIVPIKPVTQPDLLVYWLLNTPDKNGGVPPEAILLGELYGTETHRYSLPRAPIFDPGHLLLFSLARGEIVADWALGSENPGTGSKVDE